MSSLEIRRKWGLLEASSSRSAWIRHREDLAALLSCTAGGWGEDGARLLSAACTDSTGGPEHKLAHGQARLPRGLSTALAEAHRSGDMPMAGHILATCPNLFLF